MTRQPPEQLEAMYQKALKATPQDPNAPSDIHMHLPLLRELAGKCEHVTEFGMRRANGSTVAFLCGQPETFISWEIEPLWVVHQNVLDLLGTGWTKDRWNGRIGRTRFQPRVGDTREIIIEPTDMLFIDTLHTCSQLKTELERHADPIENKVRKYLVFHDTNTFGARGEDGKEPGLRWAIRWFQSKHAFPLWGLKYDLEINNGLVVLERVDVDDRPGVWPDIGRSRF